MNVFRRILRKPINRSGRKAVYTFIFGDYDDLKSPAIVTPGWDYICFTDNHTLRSDVWDVRVSPRRRSDLQLEHKKYAGKHKILFRRYLQGYDLSLSIDANLELNCNLDDFMLEHFRAEDDIMICHRPLDCIYDDAELSKRRLLDNPARINAQVRRYRAAGCPAHNGLYLSGIIARRHDRADVRHMCDLWWREYRHGSRRDQLSLNYAIWKSVPIKTSALDYAQQFFVRRNFIGRRHKRSIDFGGADIKFETQHDWTTPLRCCPGKDYVGFVDMASRDRIYGWAADRNRLNTSINISLYDGGRLIATAPANLMRSDVAPYLGDNGRHGFTIPIPAGFHDGAAHTISVRFETSEIDLTIPV